MYYTNFILIYLDSGRIMRGEKMNPYPPLYDESLLGGAHAQSTISLTTR
jgi:hypothetical protein